MRKLTLQNLAYGWDAQGNLTQRGDANQAGSCSVGGVAGKLCETFTHDALERLDTVSRNGTQTLNVDYDLIGNLTSRSDVGGYTYHATRKHAVIAAGANTYAYDANGNVSTRNGATLAWASFDLPLSLTAGANQSQFAYTPERSRWRQVATTGGITETTHYVAGLLEKVVKGGATQWKHTVATPSGLSALYLRRSDGTADTYYLLRDHLGSTDQVLKAAGSTVVVAESFSAFGARRGSNWSGAPSAADLTVIAATTAEGFTGHDMLDGVGLIHMHGRVYDPTMGRFLSVDPVVRDTAASQSWNGYGYVEGRMLSLTDPSGWAACGGNNDPKNCTVTPNDGFRERMLSRDSYHSVGGYWTGDYDPTWADFRPGTDNPIDVFAHRPMWHATGFSWSQVGLGSGGIAHDPGAGPSQAPGDGGGNGDKPHEDSCGAEPCACQNLGYAISTIASGTIAGGAAGLMQGNLVLAGGLAGVGFVAGVAQVISQPSSGTSNATQVATAVLIGGIGGAAVRGGTSVSGGIAGGVVAGIFSVAGAPHSVSGYTGGLVGGLGVRSATLSQIGANLTRGAITGLAAGLIGDGINAAGRAATDYLCQ